MYPIPANATRIRYLESTGTQWFDTDVAAATSIRFDARLALVEQVANVDNLFFGNYLARPIHHGYFFGISGTALYSWHGAGTGWTFGRFEFGVWYDVSVSDSTSGGRTANISGTAFASSGRTNELAYNSQKYAVFAGGPAGYGMLKARISSCRLYADDTLVRDFVPVRVGTVGYLFDRVSGQLFGNAGTGDFVLGPDTFSQGVVPTRMMAMGAHDALPYTREIEYLEATGTQYVDTGVLIGPTTRIESSFACTSSSRPKTASLYYVTEQSPKINGVRTNNSGYLIAVVGGVGNQNGYDPISPRTIKTVTDFSTGYVFIRLQQGDSYIRDMSKTGSPLSEANTISMYIFANNNGGVANSFGAFRFMTMRVWESGVLVRDYIPVRKGTTGYLYDRVSKQLFGNAGTGSFTLGPDK